MGNLQRIKSAKVYIDKLADGIDPISGKDMPDDALLNDSRLTRCFFCVSETLGAVISNGGVGKEARNIPFFITSEQKSRVTIEEKCYFSYFIDLINEAAEENGCMKLSRERVYYWLVLKGFMREYYDDKRLRRAVTPAGESLGMKTEQLDLSYGSKFATTLGKVAQTFIIDNLDAIVLESEVLEENKGKPWTNEEDKELEELRKSNQTVKEIATKFGRSRNAVKRRLEKLGLV